MGQISDGKEYMADSTKLVYKDIPRTWDELPEAEVRQKLAKNRLWYVCRSSLDEANKKFLYEVVVNQTATEQKEVTFAEACKDFGWKSFELVNNLQTIKFELDEAILAKNEKLMAKCQKEATARRRLNVDDEGKPLPKKDEFVWTWRK